MFIHKSWFQREAKHSTFRLRNAPWFRRIEKKNGVVVFHGNVTKLRTGLSCFDFFFSFPRRNFTNFWEVSAALSLTDARKKRPVIVSLILPWRASVPIFLPQLSKPWRKNVFFCVNYICIRCVGKMSNLVIITLKMNQKHAQSRLDLPIEMFFFPEPHRLSTKTITKRAGAVISRVKQ